MAEGQRVLILEARFYEDIADQLAAGAVGALDEAGAGHERISVLGAFELPAALAMAIASGRYDGFVALGCVIRGETSHYEHVCGECARGLAMLAERHRIALGFGVVTAPKTPAGGGGGGGGRDKKKKKDGRRRRRPPPAPRPARVTRRAHRTSRG
ncbi:MAG: 6,7-dimethyl-8-ribityllumazine synthase [Rhodospirillales bacterium]|nr:6,7-dimethyl-8-ribityllumazine synthase [Rhodospirillales bacterium]